MNTYTYKEKIIESNTDVKNSERWVACQFNVLISIVDEAEDDPECVNFNSFILHFYHLNVNVIFAKVSNLLFWKIRKRMEMESASFVLRSLSRLDWSDDPIFIWLAYIHTSTTPSSDPGVARAQKIDPGVVRAQQL